MSPTTDLYVAQLLKRNSLVVNAASIAATVDDQLQVSPHFPKNVAAWPVNHHSVETCLNDGHLRCDMLTKLVVVSQTLWLNTSNDRLSLVNKLAELFIASVV